MKNLFVGMDKAWTGMDRHGQDMNLARTLWFFVYGQAERS